VELVASLPVLPQDSSRSSRQRRAERQLRQVRQDQTDGRHASGRLAVCSLALVVWVEAEVGRLLPVRVRLVVRVPMGVAVVGVVLISQAQLLVPVEKAVTA
jgi:hypothetical protein